MASLQFGIQLKKVYKRTLQPLTITRVAHVFTLWQLCLTAFLSHACFTLIAIEQAVHLAKGKDDAEAQRLICLSL